jgi:hypothetical protein
MISPEWSISSAHCSNQPKFAGYGDRGGSRSSFSAPRFIAVHQMVILGTYYALGVLHVLSVQLLETRVGIRLEWL